MSGYSLEICFQELNLTHFSGQLPIPHLVWNTRLRSSAGRFSPGSRNPIRSRPPQIEVASYLLQEQEAQLHIKDTLLHEMVHYFLWHQKKPYGHTPEFHRILKRVGARRYNPVPRLSPVKHWYECPKCFLKIPARRKLSPSACSDCCKKYNRGKFSPHFLLKKIKHSNEASTVQKTIIPLEEKRETAPLGLSPSEIFRKLEEIKWMIQKKLP